MFTPKRNRKPDRAPETKQGNLGRTPLRLEALEPRIMYDASPLIAALQGIVDAEVQGETWSVDSVDHTTEWLTNPWLDEIAIEPNFLPASESSIDFTLNGISVLDSLGVENSSVLSSTGHFLSDSESSHSHVPRSEEAPADLPHEITLFDTGIHVYGQVVDDKIAIQDDDRQNDVVLTSLGTTSGVDGQYMFYDSTPAALSRNVAFVDTSIAGWDRIAQQLDGMHHVILIDSSTDGVNFITDTLAKYSGLDSIKIFSHGADGAFQVGATWVNSWTLQFQGDFIASWGLSLAAHGDLLLYGCNIASTSEGEAFVQKLAEFTGADVAASVNQTGHSDLGGDWKLEYATGTIDVDDIDEFDFDDFTDLLAISQNGSVSSTQSAGTTSLSWTHTVNAGNDRVMFVTLAIDGLGAGVNSVTFNGQSLVQVGRTSGNHAVEIWRLVNPDVVTNGSIVVSLGATTAIKGGAVVYNGVDTANPNGSYVGANGTGTSASVNVSSATGNLVLDVTNWNGNPAGYSIGAGQTATWNLTNATHRGVSTTEAGAATVTMSSTVSSSAQYEIGAISINATSNSVVVANNDSYITNEDTPTTFNPRTNDTDADGNSLTIIDFTSAANGTVSFAGGGSLSYDPNANYNGSDSFDYMVADSGLGLTNFWGLNGNATDSVGGSHGTLMNGPTTSANGHFGQSLHFDEVDDYVLLPDITYSNSFSISISYKIGSNTGNSYKYLYSHGTLSAANSINILIGEASTAGAANQLLIILRDSNDGSATSTNYNIASTIGDGNWHTVTISVSAGQTRTYLDGVLLGTTTGGGDAINPSGNVYIGAREDLNSSRFFGGYLDNVMVFNRALGAGEITDLHNQVNVATVDLTINPVNDAPTITNGYTYSLTGTNEDSTSSGTLASTILAAANWADVDAGALSGLAITDRTGNGIWQYSTDGITWQDFGTVSNSNALLITSSTQVRYIPDGNNGETATFSYRAWDQSTGSASTNATAHYGDTSSNGGTTAYSSSVASASMTITSVNDAPVLNPYGPTYNTNEDAPPFSTTVASLLSTSVTDVDIGAVQGIAIYAVSGSGGTLQYSMDGGSTWNDVPVVSATNALLLRATDQLRFSPDGLNGGTILISYYAWDQTSGSAGDTANVTARGGTTAFSSTGDVVTVNVADINDAPTITNGHTHNLTGTDENTTSSGTLASSILTGSNHADVDTGAVSGLAITATTGNGFWQYSTDGVIWQNFGAVSSSNALLITSTTQVRYVPDGNNGETATFTYRAWDQTEHVASTNGSPSYADPNPGGGTTAFSSQSATAQIVIADVNDAPIISVEPGDSSSDTLNETNSGLSTSGTLTVTDIDHDDEVTATAISVGTSGTTTGLLSNNAQLLAMLSVTENVLDTANTVGILTWTFDSGSEAFDYLAVGESLILTY
ncbi:MAG TPA: DUF4347 domain-containing protein, partial [Pirellulaceae bacterium]|nr:DUF4347 domain-containing protein [Pirellulaceae bacterium]